MSEPTIGRILQGAREAKGLTREALAKELKLPLRHLEAMESDDWDALPPGRPRPLARQMAARLDVDLEYHTGAFSVVPGVQELDPPDPRQERLERLVMGALTLISALVVLWLVVPGPSLGRKPAASPLGSLSRVALPPPPLPAQVPYPVLGELLPEAPLNDQGILVSLRSMDTCQVRIEPDPATGGTAQARTLRVSEPWSLRVKGPFTLWMDNAGVAQLEVAGLRVPHGGNVGEAWQGRFDERGVWLRPPAPQPRDVPPPEEPEESESEP